MNRVVQIIYPDKTKAFVPMDVFEEYNPFDVFMEFAIKGILWEFHDVGTRDACHNEIREADLRVRSSIFFIREEHDNARTLH